MATALCPELIRVATGFAGPRVTVTAPPPMVMVRPFTGKVPATVAGAVVDLDLRSLYLKDLTLYGCTVLDPGVFAALVGHIENGRIAPLVARTFALEQIAEAQSLFLARQHTGKIVLTLDGQD